MSTNTISVPALVRLKPNALDRLGLYLARVRHLRVAIMLSGGRRSELLERALISLAAEGISVDFQAGVTDASFEQAASHLAQLSPETQAVLGLGGGKALDTAKYFAFLANLTYYAVPTSLSNDGFCIPQSSLTLAGRRCSLATRLPAGVIIDANVCLQAPLTLWWSGEGDLVATITATVQAVAGVPSSATCAGMEEECV